MPNFQEKTPEEFKKWIEETPIAPIDLRTETDVQKLTHDFDNSPLGIQMNTYDELNALVDILDGGVKIYKNAMADGKLDWNDLQENAGPVILLAQDSKLLVDTYVPIDLSSLTLEQWQAFLDHVIDTILEIIGGAPTNQNPTTFKDLSELFNLFTLISGKFEECAADGKLDLKDALGNIGFLISLPSQFTEALKFDGKIVVTDLTPEQRTSLGNTFVLGVFNIVKAIKELQPK